MLLRGQVFINQVTNLRYMCSHTASHPGRMVIFNCRKFVDVIYLSSPVFFRFGFVFLIFPDNSDPLWPSTQQMQMAVVIR